MKYKHPAYSLPYGFALSEDPAGLSPSQATLAHYPKAVKGESPIMRNIRIDESIHLENDVHEGGKYRFGNGSETRPAIAFKGSTGTGIRRPASTAALAFSVSGTEEVRIDSTGIHPVAATNIGPIATDRILGRDTAGSGDVEELTVGGGVEFTTSGGIQTSAFTGDATKTAGGTALTIPNNTVTFAKMQDIATNSLVGRDTAATGDPENILLNATLEMDGSGNLQRAALTGDITATAGSNATTIANDAVTNTKAANMAQDTIKGRSSGSGTGDPEDLTAAQATAILNLATTSVKGLAPVLSNVATEFLNGTGAYSTPTGTTDLIYSAPSSDTAINSVTDVDIISTSIANIAAGDKIVFSGRFLILNSSGAGRVYIMNIDLGSAFGARVTTGSLGNSTDHHWFKIEGVIDVKATNDATLHFDVSGRALTAQASGANDTMSAAYLEGRTHEDQSAVDLTGTETFKFSIQSATTDATQTLKLHHFQIRKQTP